MPLRHSEHPDTRRPTVLAGQVCLALLERSNGQTQKYTRAWCTIGLPLMPTSPSIAVKNARRSARAGLLPRPIAGERRCPANQGAEVHLSLRAMTLRSNLAGQGQPPFASTHSALLNGAAEGLPASRSVLKRAGGQNLRRNTFHG